MLRKADHAALVARQGAGARYDAPEAPAEDLLLARHGTAYFSRLLNGLRNDALCRPDRARVVAEVGYHARGFARLMAWARTGNQAAEHESHAAREAEIDAAVSLPPRALRGLFDHSAIHLDVEWRDLPGPAWSCKIIRLDGQIIRANETPLARAQFIWTRALRLDAGGRIADVPLAIRRQAGLE